MELTSADLRRLTGISIQRLRTIIKKGVIKPRGGNGTGNYTLFHPLDAMAICLAGELWDAGFRADVILGALDYIRTFDDVGLIRQFAKGNNFLQLHPVKLTKQETPFNVHKTYRASYAAIAELERHLKKTGEKKKTSGSGRRHQGLGVD